MYYFYEALLFDKRHQYEDRAGIQVRAESLVEGDKKAHEEIKKLEVEYPYKALVSLKLEQEIHDTIVRG